MTNFAIWENTSDAEWMSATGKSRRQQIIEALNSILSTIVSLGGNVFEWKGSDFQESDLPGIDIRDVSEEVEIKGQRHFNKVTIELEGKVSASTSTQQARDVMADIIAKMGEKFNINNLAHKITPLDNELLDFEKGNKKFGTILIRFEIEYSTKAFQPYS